VNGYDSNDPTSAHREHSRLTGEEWLVINMDMPFDNGVMLHEWSHFAGTSDNDLWGAVYFAQNWNTLAGGLFVNSTMWEEIKKANSGDLCECAKNGDK